jgi:glucose-6-phosphate dehydrogenase assembly protein OpcA
MRIGSKSLFVAIAAISPLVLAVPDENGAAAVIAHQAASSVDELRRVLAGTEVTPAAVQAEIRAELRADGSLVATCMMTENPSYTEYSRNLERRRTGAPR